MRTHHSSNNITHKKDPESGGACAFTLPPSPPLSKNK